MLSLKNIHCRHLGPYSVPLWLSKITGQRELTILKSRDTCHYPHKLNRDCDFYVSDNCCTYYSPSHGEFTIDTVNRCIVG